MRTSTSTPVVTRQKQTGFTILELMIATMVFAIILLVVAAGILSFTKQYIKGITSSNTEAVARAVMSDVVQNIQFSGGSIQPPNESLTPNQQCIGNVVYYYAIGKQVTPGQHGLIKDSSSCAVAGIADPVNLSASQHEMLGRRMRLAEFKVESVGSSGANVTVAVVTGDDDQLIDDSGKSASDAGFAWSSVHCAAGAGSQFCAVSYLTTFVQARVR